MGSGMTPLPRHKVLVQVRIQARERDRWLRAATEEHLRLGELVREAVRAHVRDLERLHLARDGRPVRTPTPIAHAE
jgi:hypothetical protein